mmetsp:Transcript_12477/g.43326  ORF Transcript_12477/g.43326 Transcript_12477/m.43326 type:complete len:104 (-) Transcript_12477:48-359(-)
MVALAAQAALRARAGEEHASMRSSLDLLKEVEGLVAHEEEVDQPLLVFAQLPGSTAAITATAGVLLSMLLVAFQRLFVLLDQGWRYDADARGAFVPPGGEPWE